MGGLGLGAFLAGKYVGKIRNAFQCYAIIEIAVAVLGVFFHPLYVGITGWFYEHISWFAQIPGGIPAAKILISVGITVPCAMLLGMTFPLLAVGIMRLTGDGGKRTLSLLYFSNSFGAALGILTTSYFLIREFGTHGTLMFAACGNCLIALGFCYISRKVTGSSPEDTIPSQSKVQKERLSLSSPTARLWLALAFGTGFASFIYEIGWIRLLSLLMGSSSHSFDIMISAFVFGLAFGGLFAKKLIARFKDLPSIIVIVQIAMGIFALCSIYFYRPFFEAMNGSHSMFERSASGYFFHSSFKYLLALGLMFPASFCAGITLPVITYYLFSKGGGEKMTGYVYCSNTIGSILGAITGGLILLPAIQLKWTLAFGAALDVCLGVMVLYAIAEKRQYVRVAGAVAAIALIPLLFIRLESSVTTIGAYGAKQDSLGKNPESFLAVKDGRTATISLRKVGSLYSLATNGKSDGAILEKSMRGKVDGFESKADNLTVAQLAFLPTLTRKEPYNCAIIGMGTGMTLHHLLGDDLLEEVDMIEIEKAVLDVAELLRPTNERAYTDERVQFVVQDAKGYFYQSGKKYDIIISEPSNPWVSGVSSLFTKEYYRQLRKFLKPGGLLVQWGHQYSFSDDLVFSILAALSEFPYYEVYDIAKTGDYMVIAGEEPFQFEGFERWDRSPGIKADFQEMNWPYEQLGPGNFLFSSKTLGPVHEQWASIANSDYFPYVDQHAEYAFYTKSRTTFQNYLAPGFGCYQEAAEPERLARISDHSGSSLPGIDDLSRGRILKEALHDLADKGGWERAERLLTETTKPYFYSGYWDKLEAVKTYQSALATLSCPEKYRTRFEYLLSVSRSQHNMMVPLLGRVSATFSIESLPSEAWIRSLMTNSIRTGDLETSAFLINNFMKSNTAFSPDELAIISGLHKQAYQIAYDSPDQKGPVQASVSDSLE